MGAGWLLLNETACLFWDVPNMCLFARPAAKQFEGEMACGCCLFRTIGSCAIAVPRAGHIVLSGQSATKQGGYKPLVCSFGLWRSMHMPAPG